MLHGKECLLTLRATTIKTIESRESESERDDRKRDEEGGAAREVRGDIGYRVRNRTVQVQVPVVQ